VAGDRDARWNGGRSRARGVPAAGTAGAIAGFVQAPDNPRWARAQALAAAWVALAAMLPFPRWAAAAFLVGAALLSAWGIAGSRRPGA
jgi:hypothetical protein